MSAEVIIFFAVAELRLNFFQAVTNFLKVVDVDLCDWTWNSGFSFNDVAKTSNVNLFIISKEIHHFVDKIKFIWKFL